jgi:hypothetical protein
LFKFGKKIWDKIKDMADPQFEDEKPVNVFDFDTGANFKLKIRNVEGYRNYDKSEFESPSPISNEDSVIEKIWSQQHSLTAFLDAKNFKSYEDLKKKLTMVLAAGAPPVRPAESVDLDEDVGSKPTQASAPRASVPTPKQDVNFDDDEESLSYFAKLASDD